LEKTCSHRLKNTTASTDLKRGNHIGLVVHREVVNELHAVAPSREEVLEHVVQRLGRLVAVPVIVVVARVEAEEVAAEMVEVEVVDDHQVSLGRRYDELPAVPGDATSHQAVDVQAATENHARFARETVSHARNHQFNIYLLVHYISRDS